jgi:hypothetical protein
MNAAETAARKALLIARAERERESLILAAAQVRNIVSPPVDPSRKSRVTPFTTGLVKVVLPILGYTRFGKVVRMLSIGLTAYRAVRGWR